MSDIPINEIFNLRRQNDPQGLIDDLLKQSVKQAKYIHELEKQLNPDKKKKEKTA
jgi:hypothetical protein